MKDVSGYVNFRSNILNIKNSKDFLPKNYLLGLMLIAINSLNAINPNLYTINCINYFLINYYTSLILNIINS